MGAESMHDVAIVGGGPAGSTAGAFLRKYNPDLRVAIFEREHFPREHVGESQLPPIGAILHELGAWEKVEAADFPIKVGATYRWGSSPDLWDFEFLPLDTFRDEPRPAKYEGQRLMTAFQVDRAKYDQILLDHARELGCEVHEGTKVTGCDHANDEIQSITVDGLGRVRARWYLDCTGHPGLLRRTLGVGVSVPTALKNMAMWDYWENAEWAVEIGVGGTRVQVLSIDCGWIWFIPLGPTRTSIGFICPVEHYKQAGMSPEQLYTWAIAQEPRVTALTANATREGHVRSTKDWSFIADRMHGRNWFLVGESGGFADPVLAGGLTLTHQAAREVAYVILEAERGRHDLDWLKRNYADLQTRRIRQYIRFADFWYASNGQFNDLERITREIAQDAGLDLSPREAFRWLSFGGFTHEDPFLPGLGGLDLEAVRELTRRFTTDEDLGWELTKYNVFKPNLAGAKKEEIPIYRGGEIIRAEAYRRKGKVLPVAGYFKLVLDIVKRRREIRGIFTEFDRICRARQFPNGQRMFTGLAMGTLETMLLDGWIVGSLDKSKPTISRLQPPGAERGNFHPNRDAIPEAPPAVRSAST